MAKSTPPPKKNPAKINRHGVQDDYRQNRVHHGWDGVRAGLTRRGQLRFHFCLLVNGFLEQGGRWTSKVRWRWDRLGCTAVISGDGEEGHVGYLAVLGQIPPFGIRKCT